MKFPFVNRNLFQLFLICLSIIQINQGIIIKRNLSDQSNEGHEENLEQSDTAADFINSFTENLKDEANKGNLEYNEEDLGHATKITFQNKNDAFVQIEREGQNVSIQLKNDYENMHVTSENMKYEKEEEKIKKDFVNPFVKHLEEIVGPDLEKAYLQVEQGIEGLEFIREDGKDPFIITGITRAESSSDSEIEFDIAISGSGMEDGVVGFLEKEGSQGFKLKLLSKYFQNVFILNVETHNYLQKESNKMLTKMLSHLDNLITLNESESDSMEKNLTEDKIKSSFLKEFAEILDDGDVELQESEDHFEVVKLGESLCTINISDVAVGEFPMKKISSHVSRLGKDIVNNFLISSLYDMVGIINAYFAEVARLTKLSMNKENPDEYVPAFTDEEPLSNIDQADHIESLNPELDGEPVDHNPEGHIESKKERALLQVFRKTAFLTQKPL